MWSHGVYPITMDPHYRQSAIEHLTPLGLAFADAPTGAQGKYDSYLFLRGLLRAGKLRLPDSPRLLAQLRAVTSTPLPGGGTRISSPRRAGGGGHGDIVSAVVLAVWAAREGLSARYQQAAFDAKVTRMRAGLALFGHANDPDEVTGLPREARERILTQMAVGESYERACVPAFQRVAEAWKPEVRLTPGSMTKTEAEKWDAYCRRTSAAGFGDGRK